MVAPTTLPGRAYVRASTEKVSRLLFHLRARDLALAAVTGQAPTFARASAGGAVAGALGLLRTPVHSQPRFEMVDLDGDGVNDTPGLLLEQTRTNAFTWSDDFSNAAWTKSNATITADATTAPDGSATADKLVEDNTNNLHAVLRQFTGATDNANQTASIYAKSGERTWMLVKSIDKAGTARTSYINLATGAIGTKDGGHTLRVRAAGQGFWRVEVVFGVSAGATTPQVEYRPTTGDGVSSYLGDGVSGIYLWRAQLEVDGPFATSAIATTAAAATRASDTLSFVFNAVPQALSVYLHFQERGAAFLSSFNRVFQIGLGGGANRILNIRGNGTGAGTYSCAHETNVPGSGATLNANPVAMYDRVELLAQLYADGSMQLTQCANLGPEVASVRSAAFALAAAWGSAALALNSSVGSGSAGAMLVFDAKVAPGILTLQQMREAF